MRLREPKAAEEVLERGLLKLDAKRFTASWKDRPVGLTLTEFWMVHTLAKFPGHVKDREGLMREANLVVDEGTITSHVKRIRRKFTAVDPAFEQIDTVYGMGYAGRREGLQFQPSHQARAGGPGAPCAALAGYNYVREMERFLLEGQEQALLATARAVATALHDRRSSCAHLRRATPTCGARPRKSCGALPPSAASRPTRARAHADHRSRRVRRALAKPRRSPRF